VAKAARWLAPALIASSWSRWAGDGFFQIKSAERGVVLRFGKLIRRQNKVGLAVAWPIETVSKSTSRM